MKKIKLLFYTELWANAGIESVIMSLFRNFDLSKISVDIMASQNLSDFYDREIQQLGGRKLITLREKYGSPAKRMLANQNVFAEAIQENKYDVVHLHMCNAASMIYGKIAKENGAKVVVYHSHNTNLSTNHRMIKTAVHEFCKWKYEKYADLLFSCSDLATKWMFTNKSIAQNKVILIKNAIDLDKFAYNEIIREEYRKKLSIEEKLVVGHIGRFAVAKNHSFIIDIFAALHNKYTNSTLLLIGEGEDEFKIKEKVAQMGLGDSVIFYGTTKEIPQMLWSMDVFLLPSLFEGNPVVGIEAQAASTPCVFADTITKMCKLTDIVTYLSLDDTPAKWAETIIKVGRENRVNTTEKMKKEGYDIHSVAAKVQESYEKALGK